MRPSKARSIAARPSAVVSGVMIGPCQRRFARRELRRLHLTIFEAVRPSPACAVDDMTSCGFLRHNFLVGELFLFGGGREREMAPFTHGVGTVTARQVTI